MFVSASHGLFDLLSGLSLVKIELVRAPFSYTRRLPQAQTPPFPQRVCLRKGMARVHGTVTVTPMNDLPPNGAGPQQRSHTFLRPRPPFQPWPVIGQHSSTPSPLRPSSGSQIDWDRERQRWWEWHTHTHTLFHRLFY